MDKDAEIKALVDEKAFVVGWENHPITQAVFQELKEQQELAIGLICAQPINSIEAFFNHFEAIGHLRGLRQVKALTADRLETIETQLKEMITDHGN